MEYIENKEKFGIKYDLNKISKEFKKLKIPEEYNFIDFKRFENNKYIIDLSERTLGKTTCYLLLGMIFNKIYGTRIVYIRENKTDASPSITGKIFDVIKSYNDGDYLKKITSNKFNSIHRHWNDCFYCNVDENGEIIDKSPEPFFTILSCDKSENYKSGLNIPNGDFIIYDEFIKQFYTPNIYFNFMDLLSTIIRNRKSPFIIMLSNTININSMWFQEFGIYKQIRNMKKGDVNNIVTPLGTHMSIKWLDNVKKEEKINHSNLFFGFNNPKLNSITGGDYWSTNDYQHIYHNMQYENIGKPLFISHIVGEFLRLQFANYKNRMILLVTKATKIYDDDVIFSLRDFDSFKNGYYALGHRKFENLIYELIKNNCVYYSSNEVGEDFRNYTTYVFNRTKYQ